MMTIDKRLPGESARALAAFCEYRDLGPERSTRTVAQKLGKSRALMDRWSAGWAWVERAAEYDAHMADVSQKAAEAAIKADSDKWAGRLGVQREKAYTAAEKLIEKANAMLAFPIAETRSVDGKTVVKPGRWNFGDALRMLEVGLKLERLALGLPTDNVSHSGPDGGAVPITTMAAQVHIYIPDNGRDPETTVVTERDEETK